MRLGQASPARATTRLRALLKEPAPLILPGCFNAMSARILEHAGFPALYMSGYGTSLNLLGLPDAGLITLTEMALNAKLIASAVRAPLIADADTGFGNAINVVRTVEEYIRAGVAGMHLEDQVAPKRCGQLAGIKLIPAEENVRRLKCAIAARPAEGPLIIGRTDAMPAIGPEEAVRRALMYQDAGVDLVFVDGIKKISEVEIVARQVPGPKVVSIVDGNETTALTMRDLEEMGFAVVFYAVTALFSAARAMADALAVLKRDGTPAKAASAMMSYAEFSALVDLPRFQALDETYG